MIDETFRDKYRDEGFADGALTERKQHIYALERIAAAPDIEAAVHAEHSRLMDLQAREATLVAQRRGATALPGQPPNGLGVSSGPKDLGDLFAESLPPARPRASSSAAVSPSAERSHASDGDLGDLFAQDLPPARSKGAHGGQDVDALFAWSLSAAASRGQGGTP